MTWRAVGLEASAEAGWAGLTGLARRRVAGCAWA